MDKGTLARIDRKLLAGLGGDKTYRTVRVPVTAAKWSTWKRYCDSVGISMGRAVAMLMDRELLSVFGEHTASEWPVFAQQATEELKNREAKIEAQERIVDADETRMREWATSCTFRRTNSMSGSSTTNPYRRLRLGPQRTLPCGSDLQSKRCHGSPKKQSHGREE